MELTSPRILLWTGREFALYIKSSEIEENRRRLIVGWMEETVISSMWQESTKTLETSTKENKISKYLVGKEDFKYYLAYAKFSSLEFCPAHLNFRCKLNTQEIKNGFISYLDFVLVCYEVGIPPFEFLASIKIEIQGGQDVKQVEFMISQIVSRGEEIVNLNSLRKIT